MKAVIISLLALTLAACTSIPKLSQDRSPLLVEEAPYLPRQIMVVSLPYGAGSIPVGKQGVSNIFSEIIQEGPADMDALEFKRKLFRLNAEFALYPGSETVSLVIRAPKEQLAESMDLVLKTLKNPKIDTKFDEIKLRNLTNRTAMNENMSRVVSYYAGRDLYEYHPRTLDGTGSPRSIQNIDVEDVKAFSQKLSSVKPYAVVTAGPVSASEIEQLVSEKLAPLKEFSDLQIREIPIEKYMANKKTKVTIIHKEAVTDNQVLFIKPISIKEDSHQYIQGQLAHEILGGSNLSSKLYKTLREQKGLTYGAYSSLNGSMKRWGLYTFASNDKLPQLLSEIKPVIEKFTAEKVNKEELTDVKQSLIARHNQSLELPQDRLLEKMRRQIYGLDPEFMDQWEQHLLAAKEPEIQSFAKEHIEVEGGALYLMGDAGFLKEVVQKLGWTQEDIEVVKIEDIL